MSYAIEHTGEWCGVRIPGWLRVFDVRAEDKDIGEKAPWGAILWSGERAEVDLGLRGSGFSYARSLVSCSTYTDARRADEKELARQLQNAIGTAERLREEYLEAKENLLISGQGGSCYYDPIAVDIGNYGWSVIADERSVVIRAFRN